MLTNYIIKIKKCNQNNSRSVFFYSNCIVTEKIKCFKKFLINIKHISTTNVFCVQKLDL